MPFPDICVDDRESCPNELPTLCFQQQTCGEQSVQLRDKAGKPYALDPELHTVCFVTKGLWNDRDVELNKTAAITDGPEGMVLLELFEEDLPKAGIWLGEFVVLKGVNTTGSSSSSFVPDDPKAIYRFKVYLESEENLTNLDQSTAPTSR